MKFDLSQINLSYNDVKRSLKLPDSPSKELAEFIGILVGDGYLNYYPCQHKYLLEIAGDSRFDMDYLSTYVKNLIEGLFGIQPSFFIRKDQNSMYLRLISKGLIIYLSKIGLKMGKKEQIRVPNWISSDKDYMFSFLRGIADTDCSLYFTRDYPVISFASKSKPLVNSIFNFLNEEGFDMRNYYREERIDKRGYGNSVVYNIKLYGRKKVELWTNLIGFRNKRQKNRLVGMGRTEFESVI